MVCAGTLGLFTATNAGENPGKAKTAQNKQTNKQSPPSLRRQASEAKK